MFHWHITDDESFPLKFDKYPELADKGAYSAGHIYTEQDVTSLVEYARMRGIRIIPEIDTPGERMCRYL